MRIALIATISMSLVTAALASVVGTTNDWIRADWKEQHGIRACGPTNSVGHAWMDTDGDGWNVLEEFMAHTCPATPSYVTGDGSVIPEHPEPQITLAVSCASPAEDGPLVISMWRPEDRGAKHPAVWRLRDEETRSVRFRLDDRHGAGEPYETTCLGARPGGVTLSVYDGAGSAITNVVDEPAGVMGGRLGRFGTVDYVTGRVAIDLQRTCRALPIPLRPSWATITWTQAWRGLHNGEAHVTLGAPDSGIVLPGTNIVECWIDASEDGRYTPGELYGCARTVVGWSGADADVTMTWTHPNMIRMDVVGLSAAGDFSEAAMLTDRGVRGELEKLSPVAFTGTNLVTGPSTRIRIVRTLVNGESRGSGVSYNETIYDSVHDLDARPVLTEADLMATGDYILDYSRLKHMWIRANNGSGDVSQITNVTYRIVLGNGSVGGEGDRNNLLPLMFSSTFRIGLDHLPLIPKYPAGVTYEGRMDMTFSCDAYDAPSVIHVVAGVYDITDGVQAMIWSNDVAQAWKDADGLYHIKPLLFPGLDIDGNRFSAGSRYLWSVSSIDPKLQYKIGAVREIQLASSYAGSGHGVITVTPSYGGDADGRVVVAAFARPDFAGTPEGLANVADSGSFRILGLPYGRYFVQAFVDRNGDLACDADEPMGFLVGPDGRPMSLTVGPDDASCTVEIFDTPSQE